MSKIKTELAAVTERVNEAIKDNGYRIEIGHRNNYTAIDLCDINNTTGGCLRYLEAGLTDRQAINYLHAMLKGMDLVLNPLNNHKKSV